MAKNKNKTKFKKRSALKQATGSMYPLYYCCEWMHCIVIGGIYVAKKKIRCALKQATESIHPLYYCCERSLERKHVTIKTKR